jgi:hypothetical protein
MLLAISSISLGAFAQGHGKHEKESHEKDSDDERKGHGQTSIMWINHLDLVAGDPSVVTTFNAVNSGVGGGLSGLIIMSTTTGDTANSGGNKVVEKGLQVPPGFSITGVRVCYELSNARSFIDQIRLSQLQDPPSTALVRLDDATHQVNPGPVCVDSVPTTVNPALGEVRMDLRVNFGDTSDKIVVRAVGLHLAQND